MNLSTVRSKLAKLEERAAADHEKFVASPISNIELAVRVLYLLKERPNDENTRRVKEILGRAGWREDAADGGEAQ